MAMIDNIISLKEAYDWEQDRIKAWINESKNTSNESESTNPMVIRFMDTWIRYFDEIQASNQDVIDTCQNAININNDPERSQIDKDNSAAMAVRDINRATHRKSTLLPIVDAAQIRRTQSRYFQALDATLELEDEARDYIERHLVG